MIRSSIVGLVAALAAAVPQCAPAHRGESEPVGRYSVSFTDTTMWVEISGYPEGVAFVVTDGAPPHHFDPTGDSRLITRAVCSWEVYIRDSNDVVLVDDFGRGPACTS